MSTLSCAVRLTIFSTGSKFWLVFKNFNELHALTQAAHFYALLGSVIATTCCHGLYHGWHLYLFCSSSTSWRESSCSRSTIRSTDWSHRWRSTSQQVMHITLVFASFPGLSHPQFFITSDISLIPRPSVRYTCTILTVWERDYTNT